MNAEFFGGFSTAESQDLIYKTRRKELLDAIKQQNSAVKDGIVVLYASLEGGAEKFRQDKDFYYYTGINEPGAVLVLALDGTSTLYVPHYFKKRSLWMNVSQVIQSLDAKALGVDRVLYCGAECHDYTLSYFFSADEYQEVISLLQATIARNAAIFSPFSSANNQVSAGYLITHRLQTWIAGLHNASIDIAPIIAISRQKKDMSEIEKIYRAVEITELAHEAAIEAIKHGALEREVQAGLEYIMIASGARPAFTSIVASGKNSTVLHYTDNDRALEDGDLVVVDIGAEYNNYCADISRTYPVSGTFNKRQRDVYRIVLDVQNYIVDRAKPGMWLKNNDCPEKSLHHLAHQYLKKCGYDQYFNHSIGHFLGLDVHDVGDYTKPLEEGNVITIEPGIYIPQEGIGIRIEDNYWVTKDGVICLSDNLPKTVEEIEYVMQQALNEESSDDDMDDDEYDHDDEDEWV